MDFEMVKPFADSKLFKAYIVLYWTNTITIWVKYTNLKTIKQVENTKVFV